MCVAGLGLFASVSLALQALLPPAPEALTDSVLVESCVDNVLSHSFVKLAGASSLPIGPARGIRRTLTGVSTSSQGLGAKEESMRLPRAALCFG